MRRPVRLDWNGSQPRQGDEWHRPYTRNPQLFQIAGVECLEP